MYFILGLTFAQSISTSTGVVRITRCTIIDITTSGKGTSQTIRGTIYKYSHDKNCMKNTASNYFCIKNFKQSL